MPPQPFQILRSSSSRSLSNCPNCNQPAIIRIPTIPDHVCQEHAIEFWTEAVRSVGWWRRFREIQAAYPSDRDTDHPNPLHKTSTHQEKPLTPAAEGSYGADEIPEMSDILSGSRRLISINQAATLAQVGRTTIYHWMRLEKVGYVRTASGMVRIYADTVLKPEADALGIGSHN